MARSDAKATRAELARAGKWDAAWAALAASGRKPPPAGAAGLGMRLETERVRHELSIRELAARVGVSQQTVIRWQRGESFPGVDDVERLAEVLLVAPLVLAGWPAARLSAKRKPRRRGSDAS